MGPLRPVRETATGPFLAEVAAPDSPPVAPDYFSSAQIAVEAESALRCPIPATFVDQVAQLTGGVPWLVRLVLETHEGEPGIASPLDCRTLVDRLGHELETAHSDLHEFLLSLSVGYDLSGPLPPGLDEASEIDDLVTRARAAGLVMSDGRLVPLVKHALVRSTPVYRQRALQRALVAALVAEGRPLDDVAEGLAQTGMRDSRVASALERAGDRVLLAQPAVALARYEQARAAGSDERGTAARRAQAASATGDLDLAAGILDDLLAHPDPPDLCRAVDVAAAVWAQRAMLQRSAEMYRWLGSERIGSSAALAAVAMVGVGDRGGAEEMLSAGPGSSSPTLLSVGAALMGAGLLDSTTGRVAEALPALMRASDMMTAAHAAVPLPESPAVLAALVALHSGELTVAASILDRAIEGEQGGPVARSRLQLLRAWVAMQADQADQAHAAIVQATADARGLAPRDELLHRALEVGLARRADDAPALVRAWQRARESLLHLPIDLYSLLPLGELVVAATRLRDSTWLEVPLAEAWTLLDRLGNPPLWSAPLHWSAVQSAILTDRPAEVAPHAAALVRASADSHAARVLAAAGRAWVAVRAGHFEVAAVDEAARALASIGLTWDGARLAGHAAARTDERKDMARLLACARSLRSGSANSGSESAEATRPTELIASHPVGAVRDENGLSAREREVARLVLEGNTYEEIGEAIFISPRTVEHHVARIRRQLGVSTRSEMLAELRFVLGAGDPSAE